jgi:hypothetical protein
VFRAAHSSSASITPPALMEFKVSAHELLGISNIWWQQTLTTSHLNLQHTLPLQFKWPASTGHYINLATNVGLERMTLRIRVPCSTDSGFMYISSVTIGQFPLSQPETPHNRQLPKCSLLLCVVTVEKVLIKITDKTGFTVSLSTLMHSSGSVRDVSLGTVFVFS